MYKSDNENISKNEKCVIFDTQFIITEMKTSWENYGYTSITELLRVIKSFGP